MLFFNFYFIACRWCMAVSISPSRLQCWAVWVFNNITFPFYNGVLHSNFVLKYEYKENFKELVILIVFVYFCHLLITHIFYNYCFHDVYLSGEGMISLYLRFLMIPQRTEHFYTHTVAWGEWHSSLIGWLRLQVQRKCRMAKEFCYELRWVNVLFSLIVFVVNND